MLSRHAVRGHPLVALYIGAHTLLNTLFFVYAALEGGATSHRTSTD